MSEPSAAEMRSATKTAIYELTTGKVKEYRIGNGATARIVKYQDLPWLHEQYAFWDGVVIAEASGGSMCESAVMTEAY